MKVETVSPNIRNFIKSLRDVGYSFEVAVADIMDNCLTAKSTIIKIYTVPIPNIIFCILDNGSGMSEKELTEAMRLATKNPDDVRDKFDLGRFGLGLKTASFSQCKKLTVISKSVTHLSLKQWDLDFISENNEWLLITPEYEDLKHLPLVSDLMNQETGTLVIWQNIDRYEKEQFIHQISRLQKHIALVFHRFLEGFSGQATLKIFINNNLVLPFNPFVVNNNATQELSAEKIQIAGAPVFIQPFILPHHSKMTPLEYEQYATEEGYTKSQGFYLYRANRLLVHGTWWGLHKTTDAHMLVRIKIDITNSQDQLWGIDIKKCAARPATEIKNDLIRIIKKVTVQGSAPFTGRGKIISDKTLTRFWDISYQNDEIQFILNKHHPLYQILLETVDDKDILIAYLKGIQAYLPLASIQAQVQQNPYQIKQELLFNDNDISELIAKIKSSDYDENHKNGLLKTELFRNKMELLPNENK